MTEEEMIRRIQDNILEKKDLLQVLENIASRPGCTALREAIHQHLRTHHPATATKMFGAKDHQAKEMLEKVRALTEAAHDLSGNQVQRHVKTGGDQISGAKHVCAYISYKNKKAQSIQLALEQDQVGSEMYATVRSWQEREKESERVQRFAIDDWPAACDTYRTQLRAVVGGTLPRN